jgi:hypothetical protein
MRRQQPIVCEDVRVRKGDYFVFIAPWCHD